MRGTIIFEDDLINYRNYRFEVNLDDGSVVILNYRKNEQLLLGKYPHIRELPDDSILFDLSNIPEIKNFHDWIIQEYEENATFLNVKDLIIKDLQSCKDFDSLTKTISRHLKRAQIEMRDDDITFD